MGTCRPVASTTRRLFVDRRLCDDYAPLCLRGHEHSLDCNTPALVSLVVEVDRYLCLLCSGSGPRCICHISCILCTISWAEQDVYIRVHISCTNDTGSQPEKAVIPMREIFDLRI
jgi:hypothetical protein